MSNGDLKFMQKKGKIEWQPIRSKEVFSSRVFKVYEKESSSPENETKSFISLNAPDWVVIVPVLKKANGDEDFIMVEQWRHGAESVFVEFPGGVIDKGERPEDAARRELLEETGRNAKSLKLLSVLSPNPAIMENHCHIFLAEIDDSLHEQNLDSDEFVNTKTMSVKEVLKKMGSPKYAHAIMTAAAFLYLSHIQESELPK